MLGTSNCSPKICSPMEDRKTTLVVGDVRFSSITAFVGEIGEVLDWISDLETSGSLYRPVNGIRV